MKENALSGRKTFKSRLKNDLIILEVSSLEDKVLRVYKAWEKYISSGKIDSVEISPTIARSWKRCLEMKVDPCRPVSSCLSPKDLKKKIEENKKLIDVATPFMQEIYRFVAGSGFAVVLVDTGGYILEVVGDEDTLREYIYLRPGESWLEEKKGTNAMGTALVEMKPLQVHATEHFCKPNQNLTCSAAPIYDDQNRFIGILDLSGNYKKVHIHTLGMVVAAVTAINNQFSLERASEEVVMAYDQLQAILESMSEGLLSFDKDGRVTRINSAGRKILGVFAEEYLEKDITEIFATDEIKKLIFDQGTSFNDLEMVLDTKRGRLHFTSSSRLIRGKNGNVCGGVMTIKEIKHVRKLVNQMVGAQAQFTFDDIIGISGKLKEVIQMANRMARGNSSILLEGESGTGKEVFAQAIHNCSNSNKNNPFVAINCGAIPRELIESELFGYEEGAFTGARRGGRPGKFELANGGTIFLDEIGDMPLDTQVALLRVLQEKQVIRVGGTKPIPIDIRVIAATNKDLNNEVQKGNFRLDLYYRLNVLALHLPSLRERKEDILVLANHFIKKLGRPLGKSDVKLSPEVEEMLLNYRWPGNVRELENVIERALYLATGEVILPDHLPEKIKIRKTKLSPNKHQEKEIASLDEAEKSLITRALTTYAGNISRTAEILGICRNTLYRKIKQYDIHIN